MRSRLELQTLLESLLGTKFVYFQPPPTVSMSYPCIIYSRSRGNTKFADNIPYTVHKLYTITVIDKNPDTLIPDKVSQLPSCIFDRSYVTDNLYHYIFTIAF